MGRRTAVAMFAACTAACSLLTSTDDLNDDSEPREAGASSSGADGNGAAGDSAKTPDALDEGTIIGLDTNQPMTGDEYAAMVKSDGPISYWRLAETSGTTARDEMGTYDGAWSGSPDLGVAGPFAGTSLAARFKGAEWVAANALANRSTGWSALTMEAWFTSELAAGAEGCITQFADTSGLTVISMFRDDTTNATKAHIGSYFAQGTTSVLDTSWHHLVVTVGGGSIALYFDGKAEAQLTGTQAVPTAGFFGIGTDYEGLDGGPILIKLWVGRLAEIAIYDKVLPESRIAAHRAARAE